MVRIRGRLCFLIIAKSISWETYTTQVFIPTLLGNVIGGFSLVAALGHGQVVGGKEEHTKAWV
jgi:formate-nitrite transporter family protein